MTEGPVIDQSWGITDLSEADEELLRAKSQIAALREALEGVAECERARRSGGPEPEDLLGLDDALAEAVEIAVQTLAATEPEAHGTKGKTDDN